MKSEFWNRKQKIKTHIGNIFHMLQKKLHIVFVSKEECLPRWYGLFENSDSKTGVEHLPSMYKIQHHMDISNTKNKWTKQHQQKPKT